MTQHGSLFYMETFQAIKKTKNLKKFENKHICVIGDGKRLAETWP